ncbi:MAG: hypothetical protein JWM78_93 [Verrucomicrobiaceae bacterium]|nr:hypothetical protein [Verrucomicrobiaceae bacterium]
MGSSEKASASFKALSVRMLLSAVKTHGHEMSRG